jgi:PAS domain S-box-containing protein
MTNAEGARIVGLPEEEIIGRPCADLFPTISAQLRVNDRRAAAELEPVIDEAVLSLDGEPRTYLTVTFALPDEDGQVVETCTVATDVTERREREEERRERADWEERIGGALRSGRMLVYAQPICAASGGEPVRHELLVRMRGEDGSVIEPDGFLPAAERLGLVQAIDVWMVEQALRLEHLAPSVNMSAVTLDDPLARERILALLAGAPEAAAQLVFEITETASTRHLASAAAFAEQIAVFGCGLALDDFGTGFGSFTYLRRLRPRYLKIDIAFVRDIARSAEDERVVEAIVGIARQLGLTSIAEGIEDAATLERVRALGADWVQGYHLGRPAPV